MVRLEPYPLRHRMRATLNKEQRRSDRLCGRHTKWVEEAQRRYETVQLAFTGKGWMLAYGGVPCTGTFKTRLKAIGWFAKGGR